MKRTSPKKRITARSFVRPIALLTAVCASYVIGFCTCYYVPAHAPLAASAFTICGMNVGAVVTYRDGTQEFFKPSDPALMAIIKKLPDKSKGMLTAPAPVCQHPDAKVF